MTYTDFVAAVAVNAGVSKVKTKNVTDAVIKTLTELITDGEEIVIPGFGKFCTKVRGERECFNFVTNERITVPAHRYPAFKYSANIRNAVKELLV